MPLPSRKKTVTAIVVGGSDSPEERERVPASALVAKKVAVTICGPALTYAGARS